MFLLVAHFAEPAPDGVLELLAAQPGCRRLSFARSTDQIGRFVLVAEFDQVRDYRAALAPFDVRTMVIPWLSTAAPGSGVYETLLHADDGGLTRADPIVEPGLEGGPEG